MTSDPSAQSPGDDDPYEVGQAAGGAPGGGASWPRCLAGCLVLGLAFSAWCVWFWTKRVRPKFDQVACSGRLKDVQFAAMSYADRTKTFPYTGRGFAATFALLEETDDFHMGYHPRCPSVPGYAGYDAPFPVNTPSFQMVAWCESPHPGGYVIVTADCSVWTVTPQEFAERKASYDRRVAKALAVLKRSQAAPAQAPLVPESQGQ